MKDSKKIWLAMVVIGIIAIVAFAKTSPIPLPQQVQNIVGSQTGPDNTFECTSQNGYQTCKTRIQASKATTTVCSIKSPSATSTLRFASFQTGFASSSGLLIEMGVGANTNATTTLLARSQLAASGKVTLVATSTALNTTLVDGVVGPNKYVNVNIWGVGGATSATQPIATCMAQFDVN